jgi:hypothetical protein
MSDDTFDTLEFVGRRVPDHSVETDTNGHKYQVELPGTYEVGLRLQGVFRPIAVFPAAGLLADIQRAQNAAAAEASSAQADNAPSDAQPAQ